MARTAGSVGLVFLAMTLIVPAVWAKGDVGEFRDPVQPVPAGSARARSGEAEEAGKGRKVQAGSGFRRGAWWTLNVTDGLLSTMVSAIAQDRGGSLWFGTSSGVSQYDGEWITTFTEYDGLGDNAVLSVLEDRHGNLWFGTEEGGVSRYDGRRIATFTTQDGLAGNSVLSMLEDRHGNLWFGTWGGGVSWYDGRQFTTFTTEDGLAGNEVRSMLEDRQGNLWFGTSGRTDSPTNLRRAVGPFGGVSRYDGSGFTTLTMRDGLASDDVRSMLEDRHGNLWFGTWGAGVCRYDGRQFATFTTQDGLAGDNVMSMLRDREGNLWFGTWGAGVSQYDGNQFITFKTRDGLGGNAVMSILEDREGNPWFGTDGGVSRYDGRWIATFTTEDGLASDDVWSLLQDREGNLWFGSSGAVSRYDGQGFTTFTTLDGLADGVLGSMLEDRQANLWFGSRGGGVSRYDGEQFTTFTTQDGLASGHVRSILEDRQGNLWFGTWEAGVSCYDGKRFTTFSTKDGLADDGVRSMLEDRHGNLWFGTWGLSRYDGKGYTTFTTKDGLAANEVMCILEDRQGDLWFGTWGGGVSRYDGRSFTTLTTLEGLADNIVLSMVEDQQGHLWFGTRGGGVSQYDGTVFQNLVRQDGLANNEVRAILRARNGDVWLATGGGVIRYRSHPAPPPIQLIDVVADRRYGPIREIRLPSSQPLLAFEFRGISYKTRAGQMVYLYRLEGHDPEWRQTREGRAEYQDLPSGEYLFRAKAVGRDLGYSEEPVEVKVTIHPPYGQLALFGGLGLAMVLAIVASGYGIRRRRERDQAREALMREMANELQTAHDLQMALMPTTAPQVAGLDVAGHCIPANHVGGDFFQYFPSGDKLDLCLADVTGAAMEAAIPVVMFNGILDKQMELGGSVETIFEGLNRTLHRTLDSRTFLCFTMAEIDPSRRSYRLSNAGCPYPYHYEAATGQATELQVSAYPLGVRANTEYGVIDGNLGPGDRLVFCSDGIVEAENADGEQFGYDRMMRTVRAVCEADLPAEDTIDRMLARVEAFSGEVAQADDMTCVVVTVLDA